MRSTYKPTDWVTEPEHVCLGFITHLIADFKLQWSAAAKIVVRGAHRSADRTLSLTPVDQY